MHVTLADPGGSGRYVFIPDALEFGTGETISFTLESETEFHTFTVEEMGIDEAVDGGDSATFSFTFDTPGTYKLICIPHEALGMVGEITVSGSGAATGGETSSEPSGGAGSPAGSSIEVALADPGRGGSYHFAPDTLTFRAGTTVELSLKGGAEFHTFTVEDLGIDEVVDSGQTVTLTFTFDKPGTYKLICIPHEALGMVGEIIVQ